MDIDGLSTLLGALLGGAGGEAGKQAVASLQALMHRYRPPRGAVPAGTERTSELDQRSAPASSYENTTNDVLLQHVLAEIGSIAATSRDFARELEEWYAVNSTRLGAGPIAGNVNTISGGTFHSPVTQAYRVTMRPDSDLGEPDV